MTELPWRLSHHLWEQHWPDEEVVARSAEYRAVKNMEKEVVDEYRRWLQAGRLGQ